MILASLTSWYSPFLPALAEDLMQWGKQGRLAVLNQIRRNPVGAWGFDGGQAVNGLTQLLYGGLSSVSSSSMVVRHLTASRAAGVTMFCLE